MSDTLLPSATIEFGVARFAEWYTSHSVLASEQRSLFARGWQIVATSAQLAVPGDYVSVEVAGIPLLVVRDENGALRAFQNLCRHRGMRLVTGCANTGRFLTCPYHQWSYRRDGTLAVVPQEADQFPGIDHGALGLIEAGVGEWAGLVLVQALPDGSRFEVALEPFAERLAPWVTPDMVQVAEVSYEVQCNWKFLVENHIDVYHLWYLHQRSLSNLDHRRFFWEFVGDNWWSIEPWKDPAAAPRGLEWLSEQESTTIGAHLLFPNVMIVTCGAYLATYDAVPLAPDRTRLTLRIRACAGADGDALVAQVRSFLSEDVIACEALQAATGSPDFGFGPLAQHHEAPIATFHQAMLRRHRC
jgi:choline monooxygenase